MGKKTDALLGRREFKVYKFKPLVDLAISRIAVLRKQRQARCSLALSDIVQLLKLGHHDRALLRVEQVIKEQNTLDVYVMVEGYCNLLAERISLIEQERVCPDELKEAVSGVLYASTRCGDFPELQEMRAILTTRFGKEFASSAMELRNKCGVNPKMIQKLSTRHPSLENRLKVLKEIASENNIVLQFEDDSFATTEEKMKAEQNQHEHNLSAEIENMGASSDSMQPRRKYKDVADAAEAAFKSAAYAAEAARAAVELSKSGSYDPDDQNSSHGPRERKMTDEHVAEKFEVHTTEEKRSGSIEEGNDEMSFERVHPVQNYDSEADDEDIHIHADISDEEPDRRETAVASLNTDSEEDVSKENQVPLELVGEIRPRENGSNFDEGDDIRNEQGAVLLPVTNDLGMHKEPSLIADEDLGSKKYDTTMDEDLSERNGAKFHQPQKKFHFRSKFGLRDRLRAWKS